MSLTIPRNIKHSAPNSSQTVELVAISSGEWTEDDVAWMKLIDTDPRQLNWNVLLEMIARGEVRVFRIVGPAEGIWMVRAVQHPNGLELCCWGAAGSGLWKCYKTLWAMHKELARHWGCRWQTAWTNDERILKILKRVGLKPFNYGLIEEVSRTVH